MREPRTYFGEQLRKLRERRNLTQAEFGLKCGINRCEVSQYETTTSLPLEDVTNRLVKAFNVNAHEWVKKSREQLVKNKARKFRPILPSSNQNETTDINFPSLIKGSDYEHAS